MYYAPSSGTNCTSDELLNGSGRGDDDGDEDTEGRQRADGGYKPLCGVDVAVSPGGDENYRCVCVCLCVCVCMYLLNCT